jgi:hypothetical protein
LAVSTIIAVMKGRSLLRPLSSGGKLESPLSFIVRRLEFNLPLRSRLEYSLSPGRERVGVRGLNFNL